MSDSDAALVARTLEGDLTAYGVLMSRYRDSFGRYAFHMLGNHEDAQEAMQDSFVRAYRGLKSCRQPDRFDPVFLEQVRHVLMAGEEEHLLTAVGNVEERLHGLGALRLAERVHDRLLQAQVLPVGLVADQRDQGLHALRAHAAEGRGARRKK